MRRLLVSLIATGSLLISGCLGRPGRISFVEGEVIQRVYQSAQSGVQNVPFFLPLPGGFITGVSRQPYYNLERFGVVVMDNNHKLHTYDTSKEFFEGCVKKGTWVVPCSPREYEKIINFSNK